MLYCRVQLRNIFIAANGAASQGSGNESQWRDFLRREGATGEHIEGLEANWLRAKGGVGGTNADLWSSYLSSKGFTGSLNDKQAAFFIGGVQA